MSKKFTKTFLKKFAESPKEHLKTMTEDEVANMIQQVNYHYYTLGETAMNDDIYDIVKQHLAKINPKHPILKNVGAKINDDDSRKERLPHWMGSMDKIKSDSATLANFKNKHPGSFVISDKLDGVSAMFYTKDGEVALYTRGDGEVGQNISHLLPFIGGIPDIKAFQKKAGEFTVRGELIMSKGDFEEVEDQGMNARNMVAGLANAKIPNLAIARRMCFVAYALLSPLVKPSIQFVQLKKAGFNVVWNKTINSAALDFESLSEVLLDRRKSSVFEIDGIIVCHDEEHKVVKGKNPAYAFAFKNLLTQETAEVIVTNVEWNISKDGYIKPVVEFDGVKLSGVIIKRATGFNADFIKSNVIGPGSRILITRSGDVIPYIRNVLSASSSGKPQMPSKIKYKWNETNKEIYVEGGSEEQQLKLLENFFDKIDIKGVGPATVKALFDGGYTDIKSIMTLTEEDLEEVEGVKNKAVVIKSMREKLCSLDCVLLMDASNMFGRGFGEKRLKTIVDAIPKVLDGKHMPTIDDLVEVEGVSRITAEKFIEGLQQYRAFVKDAKIECVNRVPATKRKSNDAITRVKGLEGQKVVFTGFRNKEWEQLIEDNGGSVSTTVSSKTTLLVTAKQVSLDDSTLSSKIRTAIERGINCMSKDEFEKKYCK